MESNQEWTTGTVQFSINGEPIEMELTVPAKPVKLTRMLPIFQQMTDSFLQVGVAKAEGEGKTISCKAGCGACCRQLVPISEAESLLLSEVVENMPEPRRSVVKQRFADACRRFIENGWAKRVDGSAALSSEEQQELSMEYFREGIPCPFLEDEACSVHPHRPLACREYLVTSPAENCLNPTRETIEKVRLLFMLSDTVMNLENRENTKPINFVPLVFALAFAGHAGSRFKEKPGPEWVRDFFRELGDQLPKPQQQPQQ